MKSSLAFFLLYIILLSPIVAQTVMDVDGNSYRTISIGKQTWMAENLQTKHYRDGTAIRQMQNKGEWKYSKVGTWCYYDRDSTNNSTYGKLYNWYAVADTHGLCPVHWHVPGVEELQQVTHVLGGGSVAGRKMETTNGWKMHGQEGDNSSGFSAAPGGYRYEDGNFTDKGYGACFWSASGSNGVAWCIGMGTNGGAAGLLGNAYVAGLSVRCVKDTTP